MRSSTTAPAGTLFISCCRCRLSCVAVFSVLWAAKCVYADEGQQWRHATKLRAPLCIASSVQGPHLKPIHQALYKTLSRRRKLPLLQLLRAARSTYPQWRCCRHIVEVPMSGCSVSMQLRPLVWQSALDPNSGQAYMSAGT